MIKAFFYLGVAPALILTACIAGWGFLYNIGADSLPVPDSLSDAAIERISQIANTTPADLILLFWQLCMMALMTKFYVYLTAERERA